MAGSKFVFMILAAFSFIIPVASGRKLVIKKEAVALTTLGIFTLAVVIFLFVYLVRYCIKLRFRTIGPRVVRLFPLLQYSELNDFSFGVTRCNICLADFAQTEYIRMLPCSHVFHHDCIVTWMTRRITCPDCRRGYRHIVP
uniref:RING-H2 finger protein ATL39-like n=1 Tax=Nicotiana sylvestris TaxID=4096 RepID=A0A1U7YF95_NICSY|nr:PREDICTED: RING-H2 finger protein ATL39-like [Nicotiana sylvestris]